MQSKKKRWGLKMDQRRIYYGDGASSLGWRPWCFKRVVVDGGSGGYFGRPECSHAKVFDACGLRQRIRDGSGSDIGRNAVVVTKGKEGKRREERRTRSTRWIKAREMALYFCGSISTHEWSDSLVIPLPVLLD